MAELTMAKVEVPYECVEHCLRILEIFMDEHPECDIICDYKQVGDRFGHKLTIKRRKNYGEE